MAVKKKTILKKKEPIKKKVGRPKKVIPKKIVTKKKPQANSKWQDWYLEIIKNMLCAGRTIQDICVALGVSKQTYHHWKNEYFADEILDSMEQWQETADKKVESALFRRATGYIIIKEENIKIKGKLELVKKAVEIPGDVQAQRYWLNNRKRKDWSEKNEKDNSGGENRKKTFGFKFDDEAEPF